jgi:hypothetical protein
LFPFRFPFFPYCALVLTILLTTLPTILPTTLITVWSPIRKGGHMTILPIKLDKSVFIEVARPISAFYSLYESGFFEFNQHPAALTDVHQAFFGKGAQRRP